VWTLLAQARAKSSRSTAEAALRRIYRVEPGYRPDTSLYPPSFRKLADDVRKKQAKAATSRLDVAVSPAGRDVYVDGRKLGTAPVSLRLPPGSYRVEADFGHRSTFRTVEVPEPPQLAPPLELAAEVEGALRPDGGPCVDPAKDPGPVLARTASLLRVERLLALHGEGPPDRRVLVLDDVDRSGAQTREARARLSPGAPETEALAPLADLVATGRASAAVDVTRGTSLRTGPAVEGHLLGQLLGSPAPTGFTLEAYGVEGHVVREAVHLAGGRYDISEIPARRTVLHVTTDDGRVALAVVDTGHGELRKDLTLEQPCSVTGSLVDETGKPVGGARVFAALRPSGAWRATKSGPRGHFVIKELVRGDYELLSGSARARISVGRVSLSGACQAELPVVVVPRAALIGDPETESATRGQ